MFEYESFVTIFELEQDFNALRRVDWLGDSMNIKFLQMRVGLLDAIECVKYTVEEAFRTWRDEHKDPEAWAATWLDGGVKALLKYDMQLSLGWRFNLRENIARVIYEEMVDNCCVEMRCPSCFTRTEEEVCACGCLTEEVTLEDVKEQVADEEWDFYEPSVEQVRDILVTEAYQSWWEFVIGHTDIENIVRRAEAAMDLFYEADEAEGDQHIALWISALDYAVHTMHVSGYILEDILTRDQIESLHAMIGDH